MDDKKKRARPLTKGKGLLLLLLLVLLASGCWDRRELDTLAVNLGMGINLAPQGEGYEVSFQIARAKQIPSPGGGSGGGGETKPFWILRSTGPTVFEAVRNATFQSSRRLFLSHNQVVIISEEVARKGVLPALDFLIRDHEPRGTQWLLLTPEDPVEILDAAPGLELVTALAIADLIQDYYLTSKIRPVNLVDFTEAMMQKTSANTLPIIKTKESAGKRELLLDGTGVLKEDKLVGYLDRKETRGLLWVLGEVKGGLITVDVPGGGKATLEITNTSTKLSVEFKEGKIHAKIEVKERAGLGTQTSYTDLTTPGQFKKLEMLQAKAIESEIRAALAKAREYKADIFGFGEYLFKHDYQTWQRLEKEWERYFVDAKAEIKVETMLQQVGLDTRPTIHMKPGEF